MSTILKAGQTLKGRLSTCTLTKELHRAIDDGVVFLANNMDKHKCIVKGIAGHWRLQNEANILRRYQVSRDVGPIPARFCQQQNAQFCVYIDLRSSLALFRLLFLDQSKAQFILTILRSSSYQAKTPHLRPLVDQIQEPAEPPSIVLRYLDTDLLRESNKQRLSRPEIKQVAKALFQALKVLHKDGIVHTDINLDNIFINHGNDGRRISAPALLLYNENAPPRIY